MPYNTSAAEVEKMKPDGVFLSNGPGDPEDVIPVIELVKKLRGEYPIFGICLGHQMISLACGAETYKLKFGHRGGNHPVKESRNRKNRDNLAEPQLRRKMRRALQNTGLEVTHINLLDDTVEGRERRRRSEMFSVQYHPESAPGPQDSAYLIRQIHYSMMEGEKNA